MSLSALRAAAIGLRLLNNKLASVADSDAAAPGFGPSRTMFAPLAGTILRFGRPSEFFGPGPFRRVSSFQRTAQNVLETLPLAKANLLTTPAKDIGAISPVALVLHPPPRICPRGSIA